MAFVVTAVVAVEGAIAVTTVASVAAAVGAVGAAMTVVGAVTKSKELVKVGGVLSVVGGVTSLVNGAVTGMAGAAAAEGAASGAASGAADALASDAAASGAADALSSTAASTGTSGIFDAAQTASKFDLSSANFGVDTSLMKGVSEPLTAGAADFSGAVKAATPSLAPAASQTIDDYVASLGGQGISTPAGTVGGGSSTWLDDKWKQLGEKWDSLSDTTKAELLKAGLSVPGAIQKQKNEERLLDLQQQKVNQTSHGSEVPVFGIIQRAQKGGA